MLPDFLFAVLSQTFHVGGFFSGASPLANDFLSDSSVPCGTCSVTVQQARVSVLADGHPKQRHWAFTNH